MAMRIPKWSKRDLKIMDEQGYKVVPCKNAEEVEEVYKVLKENKRCAQVGYIVNRENVDVYFVITKERGNKGANRG